MKLVFIVFAVVVVGGVVGVVLYLRRLTNKSPSIQGGGFDQKMQNNLNENKTNQTPK